MLIRSRTNQVARAAWVCGPWGGGEPGHRAAGLERRELIGAEAEAEGRVGWRKIAGFDGPHALRQGGGQRAEQMGIPAVAQAKDGARDPVAAGQQAQLALGGGEAARTQEGGVGRMGEKGVQPSRAERGHGEAGRAGLHQAVQVTVEHLAMLAHVAVG